MSSDRIVVVGAGLAGLACAQALAERALPFVVLERADEPGGRMRTERVDGFALDRGFQVLQTDYATARSLLDYAALDLRAFAPGALVRHAGAFHRIGDPWREPLVALRSALGPIGTLGDKLRIARLRARLVRATPSAIYARSESSTAHALAAQGFSEGFVEAFLRPFLAGVFFDPALGASSRAFEFYFRAFARGATSLPAHGIGAIPAQLAAALPAGTLRLHASVDRVDDAGAVLESGERIHARRVVLATDPWSGARLLGQREAPAALGTTCVFFGAAESPLAEPVLVLNGEGHGLVNSVVVPSDLSEHYAPSGRALVMVNVLGTPDVEDGALVARLQGELARWFGEAVTRWEPLRVQRIRRALPSQAPPVADPARFEPRISEWLFACTEAERAPSIEWSLAAGRRAAEGVAETW